MRMHQISSFSLLKTVKCKRETIGRRLTLQLPAWERINYAEPMQHVRGIPERAKLKLSLLTQSARTSLQCVQKLREKNHDVWVSRTIPRRVSRLNTRCTRAKTIGRDIPYFANKARRMRIDPHIRDACTRDSHRSSTVIHCVIIE